MSRNTITLYNTDIAMLVFVYNDSPPYVLTQLNHINTQNPIRFESFWHGHFFEM